MVSRSRTVYPPHGDLGLAGVPILSNPSLDILGVRFDCRLTFDSHVRGIVSRVSQRIGILRMVNGVYADTSVLLRCYYAFILPILEYYSHVWGSAASSYTFGFLIVRFMQSLDSVLIRFLNLLMAAAALLGCVCCTKFRAIQNTVYMVRCLQPVRG